ncbi:putative zinc-binding metallopeptidase [Bacteroides sp. 51]|uniref:zinc-binding metallopeptidase n=1 Tax=Bacteroides sp. 51 TaxID=2302938 RepID=UPI0013D69126|nr:putative zinc-binding metallopeptidase [Bacteroides sp. 51]NDV83017.1 hypothetical protein [Bacteroides sp. 51]
MKKNILYTLLVALSTVVFVSCNSDDLNSTSIFVDSPVEMTSFEQWIYKEYTEVYNIDFKYRMEDIESDLNYNLSPAKVEKSKEMAVLLKHLCLETYTEVTGSTDFIRSHFPKIVHIVGSAAYNNAGTMILGTAEGGLKMSLYYINNIELNDYAHLKKYYFKTIFHEFAHIFHQKRPYSTDFNEISGSDYVTDDWNVAWGPGDAGDVVARKSGFISAYASKDVDEDFVELLAYYVINTEAEWNAIIAQGGEVGAPIMEAKFEIVYNYMINTWDIDLDDVRRVYLRRQSEIPSLEFANLQ